MHSLKYRHTIWIPITPWPNLGDNKRYWGSWSHRNLACSWNLRSEQRLDISRSFLLRREVVPNAKPPDRVLWGCSIMGHGTWIISFLFWKQLHAYEFHRCILFIKKNGKGSGVRPWNNLFHRTEWIISHNEQLLARTAANTKRSRLSIIQGPYAYQGYSLMHWGLIGLFFFFLLSVSIQRIWTCSPFWLNNGVHFHWRQGFSQEEFLPEFFSPWLQTQCHMTWNPLLRTRKQRRSVLCKARFQKQFLSSQ